MSDIAVVGGGVIGLAVARSCAAAGADVTVLDRAPISGASSVAAGMLAPVTELHYGERALLQLNLESAAMFGGWVGELERETGLRTGYRETDTIMVAADADENAALAEVWRFQSSLDLPVERLKGAEARSLEPALSPRVRGAVLVRGDHQVEPRLLADALLASCRLRGVSFIADHAASVESIAGRVSGVTLRSGGGIRASAVVIAAGYASADIGGLEPLLRVRAVKGQLLELASPDGSDLVQRNVRGHDVYLVPRVGGRLIVGATVEERSDKMVTAGAVFDLLRDAHELVPGIGEMTLVEARAGLRPGTPDNGPLLGATEIDGLVVATGHFRNGVLLAPVTAQSIAELLSSGRAPESIRPFSPLRFEKVEVEA
jgi:glycine oxidase